ncbi:hypothetical protein BH23GEM10_BH23GEM10_06990 [soil metagenome]
MQATRSSISSALAEVADDFGGHARSTILYENGRKHVREIERILVAMQPPRGGAKRAESCSTWVADLA